MIDYFDLATKAELLRKRFNEGNNSPIDIFTFSQEIENLTLIFYPMESNLSGMCIKNKHNNCIIAINSSMTLGRQRFSLAHELYHMFYDSSMINV